jgi:hypothetical protein
MVWWMCGVAQRAKINETSLHLLRLTLQHNNPLMIRCGSDKEDANDYNGKERWKEEEEEREGGAG